jgi:hypothetical protein
VPGAHRHGVRIIGATLTPFEGTFEGSPLAAYYSAEKEKKRQAVNEWPRRRRAFRIPIGGRQNSIIPSRYSTAWPAIATRSPRSSQKSSPPRAETWRARSRVLPRRFAQ